MKANLDRYMPDPTLSGPVFGVNSVSTPHGDRLVISPDEYSELCCAFVVRIASLVQSYLRETGKVFANIITLKSLTYDPNKHQFAARRWNHHVTWLSKKQSDRLVPTNIRVFSAEYSSPATIGLIEDAWGDTENNPDVSAINGWCSRHGMELDAAMSLIGSNAVDFEAEWTEVLKWRHQLAHGARNTISRAEFDRASKAARELMIGLSSAVTNLVVSL